MNTFLVKQTLRYYLTSGHKYGHRIHSPFVYDFIRSVLRTNVPKSIIKQIENRRKLLLRDRHSIVVHDYGAGSKNSNTQTNQRQICDIARSSLSSCKYAKILYSLVNHYAPKTILELGTSLGISTLYLSRANAESQIYTIEGSETIANIAKETLQVCDAQNVTRLVGTFDDMLPNALQRLGGIEFAFIDGNHTKSATLRYFDMILPYCTEKTCLIFDDISWSEDMHEAWEEIKNNKQVSISIDICKQGIVFFRKGIVKQDFIIRY